MQFANIWNWYTKIVRHQKIRALLLNLSFVIKCSWSQECFFEMLLRWPYSPKGDWIILKMKQINFQRKNIYQFQVWTGAASSKSIQRTRGMELWTVLRLVSDWWWAIGENWSYDMRLVDRCEWFQFNLKKNLLKSHLETRVLTVLSTD